jgi:hypothetical protein
LAAGDGAGQAADLVAELMQQPDGVVADLPVEVHVQGGGEDGPRDGGDARFGVAEQQVLGDGVPGGLTVRADLLVERRVVEALNPFLRLAVVGGGGPVGARRLRRLRRFR